MPKGANHCVLVGWRSQAPSPRWARAWVYRLHPCTVHGALGQHLARMVYNDSLLIFAVTTLGRKSGNSNYVCELLTYHPW
jgi:hypothetical protein